MQPLRSTRASSLRIQFARVSMRHRELIWRVSTVLCLFVVLLSILASTQQLFLGFGEHGYVSSFDGSGEQAHDRS
jgi:hypothetical protein